MKIFLQIAGIGTTEQYDKPTFDSKWQEIAEVSIFHNILSLKYRVCVIFSIRRIETTVFCW